MLIFKSFFRKKTTKNYFIIYSFILLSLFIILFGKEIINNKYNNLYDGSFIVVNDNDYEKIKDIKGIDKVYQALQIKLGNREFEYVYFISNNDLKDTEIIVADELKKENESYISLDLPNDYYDFDIKEYSNDIDNRVIFYISNNLYNEFKKDGKLVYIFTLKNWSENKLVDSQLSKQIGINNYIHYNHGSNNNYDNYIGILNVLLVLIIILFVIVFILTSYNTIQDEEKKNNMYYKLGYNKYILKLYNVFKIIILIVSSTIFSGIIFYLIHTIYKFCF